MPIFELTVYGLLLPGAIALAGYLLSLRKNFADFSKMIIAAGAALAFASSYTLLFGLPSLPTTEVLQTIFYLAVLSLLLASLHVHLPTAANIVAAISMAIASAWLVINPAADYLWQEEEPLLWVFIMGHLLFLLWIAAPKVYGKEGDKLTSFLLLLAAAGITATVGNSGSLKFLFLSLIVCSILGAAWLATLLSPKFNFPAQLVPFVVTMLLSLLFAGHLYAELPRLSLLLLLFTLFVPKVIKVLTKLKPQAKPLIASIGIAVILLISGFALLQTFPEDGTAGEETEYEGLL
jgi:hypothetical protein